MRRTHNLKGTHIMADGKILSHEQFFAQPYEVFAENNIELIRESNMVLDPNYAAKDGLRRKYQRAEERRRELESQQAIINMQLNDLT